MGKENNQNFVSIPHDRLRKMILYKAGNAGIRVVLQEESYTSKADISAMGPDAGIWQGGRDAVLLRQAGQARAVCLQRGIQDQRRLQRGGEHPEEGVPGRVGRDGGFPVPGVSGDGRLEELQRGRRA